MDAVGPPVWLHSVDEAIYEPLGTSTTLPLPEDMALSEDSSTRDIGDWGELLVKNYLEALMVSSMTISDIMCTCVSGQNPAHCYRHFMVPQRCHSGLFILAAPYLLHRRHSKPFYSSN